MTDVQFTTLDGITYLAGQIGTYGALSDLQWITRWGEGSCGMFEASWTMLLSADFEHPALRRGTLVELMDGPLRIGSPLILSEPARGAVLGEPWKFTATGIGREVEGDHTFYAFDGTGAPTAVPSAAVDRAIVNGWRIAGRGGAVPTTAVGGANNTEPLNSVGALLNAAGAELGLRWGVGQDNIVNFYSDPTSPTWQTTPGSAALGTADDDYATVVWVRYLNSTTGAYDLVFAVDSNTQSRYARKEWGYDATSRGAITTTDAQDIANGKLALSKGRLAWANGLTLTGNELLTFGGVPADLTMVEAGQTIRIHGIYSDLLEFNGQTWLDVIIGETRYTDGAQTIDISPLGAAPRDLAAIFEDTPTQDTAA